MPAATGHWPPYQPQQFEPKWQKKWEESGLHLTREEPGGPKYYCLNFFPYPSGDGLHVGHCRNYIPTDVLARFKRMQGFNVLNPMGWDAFGEPAEQYAVAHGVHPRQTTAANTANFRRQMTLIGTSYDWSREINSSEPDYYRWTQAFFLILYRRGLAYRDTNWQWWCPTCQTTLSSHEAAGGVCWRGHPGVTKREIPAWYFKITDYADPLLDGLEEIDWPENIKIMQRNWIGRSEGAEILFTLAGDEKIRKIPVFTTRPDTLFGVTFFVLAPEHPLVEEITAPELWTEVSDYIKAAVSQSEIERMSETRPKTGVFTGAYVINPANQERVPVWVADYVLPGYGTGAVMGVPAHDQRDFEFAQRYQLPVRYVIQPEQDAHETSLEAAYQGEGRLQNSGPYNGLSSREGGAQVAADLAAHQLAQPKVLYRMRDWLISRQRYWGTPIPIVHCSECGIVPVPEDQLPVLLPEMDDFQPDGSGRSALARCPEFLHTTCPECGSPAERETDTMGGFACSSWYFLRFTSPHYHLGPFEPGAMRFWMPLDLYVGGAEHAVLHLLYARFWTHVLADEGIVPFREPFPKLLNQGMMMGPDGFRMSKSRGNTITPDSVVKDYGADSLRVYELFMAPFEQDITWSTDGINGAVRFLNRVWTLFKDTYQQSAHAAGVDSQLERFVHKTVKRVTERIEQLRFNTMISALMEFTNILFERQRSGKWRTRSFHQALKTFLVLLAPAAPHITEEIWRLTGNQTSLHQQPWPGWDDELAQDESIEIGIQVNGKLRDVISVSPSAGQQEVEEIAYALPKVRQHIDGKQISAVIYVQGRILNIVTRALEQVF